MRYYNRVINLNGYELCALRDLLSEYNNKFIIQLIDDIIDAGIKENIIIDSRFKSQYDLSTGNILVDGNKCARYLSGVKV